MTENKPKTSLIFKIDSTIFYFYLRGTARGQEIIKDVVVLVDVIVVAVAAFFKNSHFLEEF